MNLLELYKEAVETLQKNAEEEVTKAPAKETNNKEEVVMPTDNVEEKPKEPSAVETETSNEVPTEVAKDPSQPDTPQKEEEVATDVAEAKGDMDKVAYEVGHLIMSEFIRDIEKEAEEKINSVQEEILKEAFVIKASDLDKAINDRYTLSLKEAEELDAFIEEGLAKLAEEIYGPSEEGFVKLASEIIEKDAELVIHPVLGVLGVLEAE